MSVQGSELEREVRRCLTEVYRVDDLRIESGGKHKRAYFNYRGKGFNLTLPFSPSDGAAVKVKMGDIKRLLGEPPEAEAKATPRRLEDMLPATTAERGSEEPEKRYVVGIAHYPNGSKGDPERSRIGVYIGADLYAAFAYDRGGVRVRYVGDGIFEVSPRPEVKTPAFRDAPTGAFPKCVMAEIPAVDLPAFGLKTRGEALLVDGRILVSVERDALHPVRKIGGTVAAFAVEEPPKPTAPPEEPPKPDMPPEAERLTAKVEATIPSRAEMTELLAAIRRVEAMTEYRLVKMKTPETPDGKWTFSAPRIE